MNDKVWITGIGAVTAAGWTAKETWSAVVAGERFGRTIERFPLFDAGTRVGAPVRGMHEAADPTSHAIRFGLSAAEEALASAGLSDQDVVDVAVVATHGERTLPGPGHDPQIGRASDISGAIGTRAGARRTTSLYGACAGGGLAVGSAATLILTGRADIAIAGGCDSLLREVDFFSFCSLYAMTSRDCPPEESSCPFDSRRDGFLLGEGAGFVILESDASVRRRGVEPLASVDGFGYAQNAYHMVASPPDAAGPGLAMRRALEDARRDPSDIQYINAHGTSTRDNDWCETLAIRQSFGAAADRIPVSSIKGSLGHSMAAAGAAETVACVLALQAGVIPPTANLQTRDANCDLDYVPREARQVKLTHIVNNSFGFGGHNASLVLGKA
jgi:3-oxoacyl-[acyl-carrier-protein] synthase II